MDGVSRLKGIETYFCSEETFFLKPSLDGVSRLKGIETNSKEVLLWIVYPSLDGVSRLKGIETIATVLRFFTFSKKFGWSFPFEGN